MGSQVHFGKNPLVFRGISAHGDYSTFSRYQRVGKSFERSQSKLEDCLFNYVTSIYFH